jgi:hypothetical protein
MLLDLAEEIDSSTVTLTTLLHQWTAHPHKNKINKETPELS